MTYTFTYTIITHSFKNFKGKDVITNILYTVSASRSDGKNTSFDLSLSFPYDSVDKVIPHTRQKYDESDNIIAESDYANRSDFTDYASLSIPADLITWLRNHHENDANNLQGLKTLTDANIGG